MTFRRLSQRRKGYHVGCRCHQERVGPPVFRVHRVVLDLGDWLRCLFRIREMEDIQLCGEPESSVVAFESRDASFDIYKVSSNR